MYMTSINPLFIPSMSVWSRLSWRWCRLVLNPLRSIALPIVLYICHIALCSECTSTLGWAPSLCDWKTKMKFFHVTPPPPPASWCSPHLIQDNGAGLQGHQRNCTHQPSNTGHTKRPSASTSLLYSSWPAGTVIAEGKQRSLSKVTSLFYPGASVVERTPDQCQDRRITRHLLQKTQDFVYEFSTPHSMTPFSLPLSIMLL